MDQTEFRVTSDLAPLQSFSVEANFTEVQAWLEENLAPYLSIAVTEESIPAAKSYRAKINKVKAALEESRKRVKKAALEPYTVFEEKVKALTGLCDKAAGHLDGQIKALEDQRRQAKEAALHAFFDAYAPSAEGFLDWDRLFNPKWLNQSVSLEAAQMEIAGGIARCMSDVEGLRKLESPFETALLDLYRKTGDLSACLKHNAELIALQTREDEKKKEKESSGPRPDAPPPDVGELLTVDFRVRTTQEKLNQLGAFLRANGIDYGRIPQGRKYGAKNISGL